MPLTIQLDSHPYIFLTYETHNIFNMIATKIYRHKLRLERYIDIVAVINS